MNKTLKTTLILMLAVVMGLGAYYLSQDTSILKGSILDGADQSYVEGLDFVSPSVSTTPVNNVVTIDTVSVDFTAAAEALSFVDGNVSGTDLASSFIIFQCTDTVQCTTDGVTITSNEITVPTGTGSFSVDIFLASDPSTKMNGASLVINPAQDCSSLNAVLIEGTGTGLYTGDPSDLPESATSVTFDFDTDLDSIILSRPSSAILGAQTFNIIVNLDETLVSDAEITYSSGEGDYEISVKEDTTDQSETAENFMYVFNDLLGNDSPFIATISVTNVTLETKELGSHVNSEYTCTVDTAYNASCFTGGADGTGDAADILTQPLTLDNTMTEGDTAVIYLGGSTGVNEWVSSNDSVLEVTSLQEAEESEAGGSVEFIEDTLNITTVTSDYETAGTYNVECNYDDAEPTPNITDCSVEISLPVSLTPTEDYTTIVTIGAETIEVDVNITSQLIGTIEGAGTWDPSTGANFALTGEVTGNVSGDATGDATGSVYGPVKANVTSDATILAAWDILDLGVSQYPNWGPLVPDGYLQENGDFTSTVEITDTFITNYAYAYAKRDGTSILTITDDQSCVVALEVEVLGMTVELSSNDYTEGDMLEVDDQIQIDAFLGNTNGEVFEDENVTAATGIEWFTSDETVATIDSTGILTAVGAGTTNITARYDTGEAEIGTVESEPFSVTVNEITGLTISLDEATQALMTTEEIESAYENVLVIVHSSDVVGSSLTIEGENIPFVLPTGTYNNELEEIEAIVTSSGGVDSLETQIAAQTAGEIFVTPLGGFPGILVLEVDGSNDNGMIDISTTANSNDITIVPNFGSGFDLPAAETYSLMVVAEYANGKTELLNPTDVVWINTPVNYLDQTSLEAGLLQFGEISGTSTVVAEYTNPDLTTVNSNTLYVTVESGPVIEYVYRIGTGSIIKGTQLDMEVKVSDVDTIADIQDINIKVVDATDPGNIFDSTAYTNIMDITVEDEGGEEGEGEGEGEGEAEASQYRIYNIPVTIPNDQYLYDGEYLITFTITDTDNHTYGYDYPITVGEVASGDVNGDGDLDMVDVIYLFQIVSGTITGTSSQLEASDLNGDGNITMVDVIYLFQQISS